MPSGTLDGLGFEHGRNQRPRPAHLKGDLDGSPRTPKTADVAVLYYSGHGIEAGGENFLVPVDADLSALDAATTGCCRFPACSIG